jgi:hypothetical protein
MNMTKEYRKEHRKLTTRQKTLHRKIDQLARATDKRVERIKMEAKVAVDIERRKLNRALTSLNREANKIVRRMLILEGRISK